MKKTLLIMCDTVVALMSCTKEPAPADPGEREAVQVKFNLSATHPDGSTPKAVKTGWETGDVVFVFFSTQAAPRYLEMKWDGTAWVSEGKNSLALAEGEFGQMTAVYLPFGNDAKVTADGENFKFSETYETYYLTGRRNFCVIDGEISGNFDMQIPDGYVQFFLDDTGATPETEVELREPNLTPQGIALIAPNGTITHTDAVHGAPLKGYVYDKENEKGTESKGWLFSGILATEAQNTSTDYLFTLVSDGWTGDYYYKAFPGKTFYTGTASGRALKLPTLSGWTAITDYKPIDLGCEISLGGGEYRRVYWASRNLGATADTSAGNSDAELQATWGDYYAWGETAPYYTAGAYSTSPTWASEKTTGYTWDSYRWGNYSALEKYNETDGLATLEAGDDASTAIIPPVGRWHMPTETEWNALCNTTLYSRNWSSTQKGYTVTRKEGSGCCVGNSIFLPAAGERANTNLTTDGYYWSSSLRTSGSPRTKASHLYFTSSGFSISSDFPLLRYAYPPRLILTNRPNNRTRHPLPGRDGGRFRKNAERWLSLTDMKALYVLAISAVLLSCTKDTQKQDTEAQVQTLIHASAEDVSNQCFDAAMGKALQALDLSAVDPLLQVQAPSTIVGIDIMASRDEDAWAKALEAEAIAREHGYKKELAGILISKAKLCSYAEISPETGRNDEGLGYAMEALSLAEAANAVEEQCEACYVIGSLYINKNRWSNPIDKAIYRTAGQWLDKGQALADTYDIPRLKRNGILFRSRWFQQGDRNEEAIKYFEQVLSTLKDSDHLTASSLDDRLVRLYTRMGDYEKALDTHDDYVFHVQKYIQQMQDETLQEMETRFEVQEKERAIERSRYQRALLILVLLLATTAIVLGVNYIRKVRRRNAELKRVNDAKEELIQFLSKDLKNPANAIAGEIAALSASASTLQAEEIRSKCEQLTKEAESINSDVASYLGDILIRRSQKIADLGLSQREIQILRLSAEGLSAAQIAERTFLSVHTVNTHRQHIYAKMGVRSVAEMIRKATEIGIL